MWIVLVLLGTILALRLLARLLRRGSARNLWRPNSAATSDQVAQSVWAPGAARQKAIDPRRLREAVWARPGSVIRVADITIEGGMLYVGGSLKTRDGLRDENCLVNPTLPVRRSQSPIAPPDYWPSYSTLTPQQRWFYLTWLQTGRSDPTVDIGYIFLFFYGLERRLYLERKFSETNEIVAEVERLLAIFGCNRSFNHYASTFLSMAQIATGTVAVPEPRLPTYSPELPLATRVHIGRILAAGTPLDAKTTLLWILGRPETRLRTPGQRCFKELVALWDVRFAQRHANGLMVRAPKRHLKFNYRSASGTFDVEVQANLPPMPDIGVVTAPLQGLTDLLEACVTELEPYSRLLGKRPEARETMEGVLLLPAPIRDSTSRAVIDEVRTRLDVLVGTSGMGATTLDSLCDALRIRRPQGARKQVVTQIALALDRLDYALEPDMRYGTTTLSDGAFVIFKADRGAPVAPGRAQYDHARLAAEVGILAAAADGELTRDEIDALTTGLRSNRELEPHERLRLEAFILAMQASLPSLKVAIKHAKGLPASRRTDVLRHAATAIMADGRADASEVRFLERLYKAFGLSPEAAHSVLHQAATTGNDQLSPVVAAEAVNRMMLPPEPATTASSRTSQSGIVGLDQARLVRIRAETSAVSQLLSEVFSGDDVPTVVPPETDSGSDDMARGAIERRAPLGPYDGLDAAHGMVLATVVRARATCLEDFERECKEHGLMPGAALEIINDWGFEHFNEQVIEDGDDVILVHDDIRDKLATMLRQNNGQRA